MYSCLRHAGYIGEFEIVDDHRSGKVVIDLVGRINKCGVISPRFDLKLNQIEQWSNNLLPSRQFGYIVLTTSLGIMDHEEVRLMPASKHSATRTDRCIVMKTGGRMLGRGRGLRFHFLELDRACSPSIGIRFCNHAYT